MKFALSASYVRRAELCRYAADLQALGHTLTSSWLFDEPEVEDDGKTMQGTEAQIRKFANQDLQDVADCEVFISFVEPLNSPFTRGGRHCEHGAALALLKEVWLVGDAHFEHAFHYLADGFFYDWPACRAYVELELAAIG